MITRDERAEDDRGEMQQCNTDALQESIKTSDSMIEPVTKKSRTNAFRHTAEREASECAIKKLVTPKAAG